MNDRKPPAPFDSNNPSEGLDTINARTSNSQAKTLQEETALKVERRRLRRKHRRAVNEAIAAGLPIPDGAVAPLDSKKADELEPPKPKEQSEAVTASDPKGYVPPKHASAAQPRFRHWGILTAFGIMVVLPTIISGVYLYTKAADQYASTLGFTVRSEDVSSAMDLLGGLGASFGSNGGHDADILYEYIGSQELVREIDVDLDLHEIFSVHANTDPLLSFDAEGGTIEDLTRYWQKMVQVNYDSGSGLIETKVLAFRPQDARAIAEAIYIKSTAMINNLSNLAREDATRYAEDDLELALQRLKSAREALTAFRLANEIVDPNADIQAQMGLLSTLQTQQATALIDFDLISEVARSDDPRVEQARRRLEVIAARIAEERKKFGAGGSGPGGGDYATTISEFERLSVDREFAERAYAASFSAMDGARAEASRQSRYLAVYIRPTLAEQAEYPQRALLLGLVTLFSFLTWGILTLIFYALRDRK
jgi:capsular polysaccharide transport system permease protein